MCITSVPRTNRTECFPFNSTVPNFQFTSGWTSAETNCSNNESAFTSVIIRELDTNNHLHSVEINVTMGDDLSEMDMSPYDFPNPMWVVRPTWVVVLESAAFLPVVFGGVVGNLALLWMLSRARRLRTPTNLLIANMALADLINLLLGPWMLLVHHFFQNFVLGSVGCKMEGFLSGSLLITGVMNLTAVSYDRLTAIVLPQETRLSRRATYVVMGLTWLIGVVFAMPLCIWRTYKERQWKNFLETYCSENAHILPLYWHVLLSTLVWVPITIMTICYSAVFWKLDRYEQSIRRREHPLAVSYKTRVARTLFFVLITFIICRLPFTVLVFWRNKILKHAQINSVDESFQILWIISHYLIYLNCAINPIIYGLTNENYRRTFGLTPLYNWLSGISKNTKEQEKEKEKVKEKNSKSVEGWNTESPKPHWCARLWANSGKRRRCFEPGISSGPNQAEDGTPQLVCSSKLSPLPQDYI